MLFGMLFKQVASKGGELAYGKVVGELSDLISDEKAYLYARERLRDRYAARLAPVDYDLFCDNLRITAADLKDILIERKILGDDVYATLAARLRARLDASFLDVPQTPVVDEVLGAFIGEQENYFLNKNLGLAVSATHNLSAETLKLLRQFIDRSSMKEAEVEPIAYIEELRAILRVANVFHEVIVETPDFIDIVFHERDAIFPTKIYLRALQRGDLRSNISEVSAIAVGRYGASQKAILADDAGVDEFRPYANSLGLELQEFRSFFSRTMESKDSARIYVGPTAAGELTKFYHTDRMYIEPDATPARPGDVMEYDFFRIRKNARSEVTAFVTSEGAGVLFVLGGYGSGKSSLSADIMSRPSAYGIKGFPVLIELRDIRNEEDIVSAVRRAKSTASLFGFDPVPPLVILDGLDEHPSAMVPNVRRKNMLQLLAAASHVPKVIVTARTSYFRGMEDFWAFFRREGDTDLWNEIAPFIQRHGTRPRVSAIVLREFDSDQVKRYLDGWDEDRGVRPATYDALVAADRGRSLLSLAQNPLFLFLLANSRPWEDGKAKCSADIAETFVRYWLERDIEKGSSRWNLSADDRLSFVCHMAWNMYNEGLHSIPFDTFDKEVTKYFSRSATSSESYALSLDLQTTGLFTGIGSSIQFAAPLFFDYLVMRYFAVETAGFGSRIPSVAQLLLWLGCVESHGRWRLSNTHGERRAHEVVYGCGIRELVEKGAVTPGEVPVVGTVFHKDGAPGWTRINHPGWQEERVFFLSVWRHLQKKGKDICQILFLNNKGLHARASARMIEQYEQWCAEVGFSGSMAMSVDGIEVSPTSIMGLMMLGCAKYSVMRIIYSDCPKDDLEKLFRRLACVPIPGVDNSWATFLHEDGMSEADSISYIHANLAALTNRVA